MINDTIVAKTHLANTTLFMFTDLQLFRQVRGIPLSFVQRHDDPHPISPFTLLLDVLVYIAALCH